LTKPVPINAYTTSGLAPDFQMAASQSAEPATLTPPPRHGVAWLSIVVLLILLAITFGLTWGTESIHNHNESRLLKLELNQAASVLASAIPSIETPLTTAVDLASVDNGDPSQFVRYLSTSGSLFRSASLWKVTPGLPPQQVASYGDINKAAVPVGGVEKFIAGINTSNPPAVTVINLLGARPRTIGYAAANKPSKTSPVVWVVFGNTVWSTITIPPGTSTFAQLRYAIFLGKSTSPADILAKSPGSVGPGSQTTSIGVANSAITMNAAADGELGGSLLARLPWIIGIAGSVLAIIAAIITEYLVRRRRQAEWFASENRRMYREQRSIAEILQHALLPAALPQLPGVESAARYQAGREGTDVGGDWYDVIPLDESKFIFVVGDVSGHGVMAATIMARLHFAIRAYAAEGDSPEVILRKLGRLLSLDRDKSFATILCGIVNVEEHTLTLVNAGHLPPLLMNGKGDGGDYVRTAVYPPVGVMEATDYESVTLTVPAKATILAFTDGLVERRGEIIDAGLDRLKTITAGDPAVLDDLLSKVLIGMKDGGYEDDMAILAMRWNN
jgi:Stage II sporulation protein E (SpoIIE)